MAANELTTHFNQMRKPRDVRIKARGYLVGIGLAVLVVVPMTFSFYQVYSKEKHNLELKETGVSAPGKVISTRYERRGKRHTMVATYEFQYQGQTIQGSGDERYRRPGAAADITVYFMPGEPSNNCADFAIGSREQLHQEWMVMAIFALVMVSVWLFLVYWLILRPQRIFSTGHMIDADVLEVYHGRNAGAKVSYTVNGISYQPRLQCSPRAVNAGSTVAVVIDMQNPKAAIRFPHSFCEVIGCSSPQQLY